MRTATSEACSGRSRSRGVSRRGIRGLADLLEPVQVLLAELGDLGSDDHPAVSLVGVAPEIFLMVVFRRIERLEGNNLRDNGVVPDPRVVQLGEDGFQAPEAPTGQRGDVLAHLSVRPPLVFLRSMISDSSAVPT